MQSVQIMFDKQKKNKFTIKIKKSLKKKLIINN